MRGGLPAGGGLLTPPSLGRKPSLAQGAGGGSAAARFGVIRGNRAAAKAGGAPAGKDERSLGGKEAATLFTKPGRLETSVISLHSPLPGQLRRTASPSLCGSPHAKTC